MNNLFGNAKSGFDKLKGMFFKEKNKEAENNKKEEKKEEKKFKKSKKTKEKKLEKENMNNKMTIKTKENLSGFDFDEEDDEYEEEENNNNNNDEKNNVNNINENKTNYINFDYNEKEENIFLISHRVYQKKTMLDIEGMPYIPFIKVKKIENVFSYLGIGKKQDSYKEIKYLVLFDEYFIYMINMTNKENNQNNFFKKIGNHYDLRCINSIDIKDDFIIKDNGNKVITLLFILDNDVNNFKSVVKHFHFSFDNAVKFFKILKFYLTKLNIPMNYKDQSFEKEVNKKEDNNIEEKKEEKPEEKKEDNSKEIKEEKNEEKKEENKEEKSEEKKEEKNEEIKEEKNEEKKEDNVDEKTEEKKEDNVSEKMEEKKEEKVQE